MRKPLEPRHEELTLSLLDLLEANRTSSRGVTAQHRENERQAVSWLIEALFQALQHIPALPLALPLKHEFYKPSYPHPVPLSYSAVNKVISIAESHGWIRVVRGSRMSGEVTRIWPAGPLLNALRSENSQWCLFSAMPKESLVSMTVNKVTGAKRTVELSEHHSIAQWREDLVSINAFLREQCILLDMPNEALKRLGRRKKLKERFWFARVELRRIFTNESFDYGGRFYGGWWQNVPSSTRDFIQINGEPTSEVDFSAMSIRCLYARQGLNPPDDPYDVGYEFKNSNEPRRRIVKRFFKAVLNDSTKRFQLSKSVLTILGEENMKSLKQRILFYHPILEQWLHSGVGVELQFLDSEIAKQVVLSLLRKDVVCLPIHDSFVVTKSNKLLLDEAMHQAFKLLTGQRAHTKSESEYAKEGMWLLPESRDQTEEAILDAWTSHTEERYSIAMNYLISWHMATQSPEQINANFHAATTWFNTRYHQSN